MPSRLRNACLVIGALPLGWFAVRSTLAVPPPHVHAVGPAPGHAQPPEEGPKMSDEEFEKRIAESMPWLPPLRENRWRFNVDRFQLDAEANRLWNEATARELTPEQNEAVLAELDLRLRTALSFAASFQPGEGLQGEAGIDLAAVAPLEADHALLSFASGDWRAIDFDELPFELRSEPRAGTYFVVHFSRSLHTLLLFPIDPVANAGLHARKTAALTRAATLAIR